MLNRTRVLHELNTLSDKLFFDVSHQYNVALESWQRAVADPLCAQKVRAAQAQFLIPSWQGALDAVYPVEQGMNNYTLFSVDGSQIYPDRHQGTSCFLINIGTVILQYGKPGAAAALDSVPYVFLGDKDEIEFNVTPDLVNCLREEFEFGSGVELCASLEKDEAPSLFVFDGSLIFWHLESKEPELKSTFVNRYCASLQEFYEADQLVAGCISAPRNKELINILRLELCNYTMEGCEADQAIDRLIDTTIAHFFLQPFTRSTVFKSHSKITLLYPEHLQPYFFYLHVGHEMVRVELPAWIARDQERVDCIASMIVDQSIKGRGYPVALAEAHEQAVVKGPDREFFYHVIAKLGVEHKQRMTMSQKSLKKRGIGI